MYQPCGNCKKDITTSHEEGLCTACVAKKRLDKIRNKPRKQINKRQIRIEVLEEVLAEGDKHMAQYGGGTSYHQSAIHRRLRKLKGLE